MKFKKKSSKKSRKSTKKSRKYSNKKVKSRKKSTKSMTRKRSTRTSRIKGGFNRVGSSLRSGMLGEAIKGAGAARLSHVVTDRIPQAQGYSGIIAVGAGFAAGGLIGGITAAVTEGVIGGLGGQQAAAGGQVL